MGLVHFLPWFFACGSNRGLHRYEHFSAADSGHCLWHVCCALVSQLGLSELSLCLMALPTLRQAFRQQRELDMVGEDLCPLRTPKIRRPAESL